jgi:hypothetical protein
MAALNLAIALFSHDATTRANRAPGRACQPRTSVANSARCCAVGRALLEASAIAAHASVTSGANLARRQTTQRQTAMTRTLSANP